MVTYVFQHRILRSILLNTKCKKVWPFNRLLNFEEALCNRNETTDYLVSLFLIALILIATPLPDGGDVVLVCGTLITQSQILVQYNPDITNGKREANSFVISGFYWMCRPLCAISTREHYSIVEALLKSALITSHRVGGLSQWEPGIPLVLSFTCVLIEWSLELHLSYFPAFRVYVSVGSLQMQHFLQEAFIYNHRTCRWVRRM